MKMCNKVVLKPYIHATEADDRRSGVSGHSENEYSVFDRKLSSITAVLEPVDPTYDYIYSTPATGGDCIRVNNYCKLIVL